MYTLCTLEEFRPLKGFSGVDSTALVMGQETTYEEICAEMKCLSQFHHLPLRLNPTGSEFRV